MNCTVDIMSYKSINELLIGVEFPEREDSVVIALRRCYTIKPDAARRLGINPVELLGNHMFGSLRKSAIRKLEENDVLYTIRAYIYYNNGIHHCITFKERYISELLTADGINDFCLNILVTAYRKILGMSMRFVPVSEIERQMKENESLPEMVGALSEFRSKYIEDLKEKGITI